MMSLYSFQSYTEPVEFAPHKSRRARIVLVQGLNQRVVFIEHQVRMISAQWF